MNNQNSNEIKSGNKKDTKQHIINIAKVMFSEKGFDATSIRDIAKAADVNLGAVNYHFNNKQTLYLEVVIRTKAELNDRINKMVAEKDLSTRDLAYEVFTLIDSDKHALINGFKLILSGTISVTNIRDLEQPFDYGPPGAMVFMKAIAKDLDDDVSDKAKLWCVKTIICKIMHVALIKNTMIFCNNPEMAEDLLVPKNIEQSLTMLVDALITYANANKEKFDE